MVILLAVDFHQTLWWSVFHFLNTPPPPPKKTFLVFCVRVCFLIFPARVRSCINNRLQFCCVLIQKEAGCIVTLASRRSAPWSRSQIHSFKVFKGPLKFSCLVLFRHSTFIRLFGERQCSVFVNDFILLFFNFSMDCHCSFTHCSGAAWSQYNENCMCVNVVPCILQDWLSSVCKT